MNVATPIPLVRQPSSARRDDPEVNRWVAMLSAELESKDRPKNSHQQAVAKNSSVEITLEFGRTCLTDPTHDLSPGTLLRLDQLADEPIDLVVDDQIVARGELLVTAGKLGVRIVELLLILAGFSWLATNCGFADEPTRSGKSARPTERFNAETEAVIETPFGTTRGRRSAPQTTDIMPRDPGLDSDRDLWESASQSTDDSRSVPLTKPSNARRSAIRTNGEPNGESKKFGGGGWGATIWALLAVVGTIVIGARWLTSRVIPTNRGLPEEAWNILGREPFDTRTAILLVRCGSRLLLLSSSPSGLQTLAQITDPVEIDCLAGLCRSAQRDPGLAETFRSLLVRPVAQKQEAEATRNSAAPPFADRRQSLTSRPITSTTAEVL